MTQKNLLLTFDYELFLGKQSGQVEDCLINPTNKLAAILNQTGVKAIFFVDTVYLIRLKEMAGTTKVCQADFNKIVVQLQELILKGHYVFPHIHPHWLDAIYLPDTNEWTLESIEKYRFCNISKTEQHNIFKGSYDLLLEIAREVKPDYVVDSHRAGGWSVQPFTNFYPLYEEFGFKFDFSVLKRFYMFTQAQFFDYSNIPDKNIYHFNDDVTVEVPDGRFIEFVNSTIRVPRYMKFFDYLLHKILFKTGTDYSYGKGTGQSAIRINTAKPLSDKGYDMTNYINQYIAVEQMSFVKNPLYLAYLKNFKYMHFVSHPKMCTRHNLKNFKSFLLEVNKLYKLETDFRKMV